MNQTLRPQPLLSEVLPGALTLGLILYVIAVKDTALVDRALQLDAAQSTIAAGAFLLGSWMVGTFLDSVRNLLEHRWDHLYGPLYWNFFFYGARDKVAQLDEHYFAYYTAKANYVIGLLAWLLFFCGLSFLGLLCAAIVSGILIAGVCLVDAFLLRKEIKTLLQYPTGQPHTQLAHTGVYTRLAPSPTFPGIGVFAIRDIPAGRNVFAGDDNEMREIDSNDLKNLEPEITRLYCDFCVFKDGKIRGPTNFNNLTVGWYLNHSPKPNVRCDEEYDFISLREIKKGEELTVDYSKYDDRPPPGSKKRRK